MTPQEQYEEICQRVLRKHYREFRARVSDPFFVDCEYTAKIELNKMLRNARAEMEAVIHIKRSDFNSREIAEIMLGKYLMIGRKYGQRYYRKKLKIT